jgi:Na+/melibiose symporter-like transporter
MSEGTTAPRLSRKTLFYYSLADLPVAMSLFPVMVFLPKFYTANLGVPLMLAANIILLVRIFDIITDPLMGVVSDRTRSRWGRRRPWVALATPILMLCIYMLFLPPEGAGALHLGIWMALLSIGTTMFLIPYYAWGAELSTDYNERSAVAGARSMMGVVGSLLAQLIPAIALLAFGLGGSDAVLTLVGITMLVTMPVCAVLTLAKVHEEPNFVSSVVPFRQGLGLMVRNGPFLRLVAAFMVGSLALSMTTPLYLFFITFVLGAEEKAIFMLTFFYAANFASIPFWVWLSTKIGKHRAYAASFCLIAVAHPLYMLLGAGDFWWMTPITLMTGFAAGGFNALPNSMKADVIDLDTLHSGESRAALFFSSWSFTQKMAGSLGGWLALMVLGLIGFDAKTPTNNGADELLGLRLLFSTIPSLFYLGAAAIIWNYPITRERHAELRAELSRTGAEPEAAQPRRPDAPAVPATVSGGQ